MAVFSYLPSAQFALIVGSVAVSGGLVVAAQYVTNPPTTPPSLVANTEIPTTNDDWKRTLISIQSQNPLGHLPPEPNPKAVENLLEAAQSENITSSVARTVFVKLSDAKAKGLGSDVPTQEELIAQANLLLSEKKEGLIFAQSDITSTGVSAATLKTYGNEVMTVLSNHPTASYADTRMAISALLDGDPKALSKLKSIGGAYGQLARDLAKVSVPITLVPFHLQIVNNYARASASYNDLQLLASDPLRSLAGFQHYQTLIGEISRVFTNIAQELSKNSIIFNTDEPGSAWAQLLSR